MKRLVVNEHTRINRRTGVTPPGGEVDFSLDDRLYERLRTFDRLESKERDRVFEWSDGYFRTTQWVGVVQIPGLQVEILPKVDTFTAAPPTETEQAQHEARRNLLYMLAVSGDVPVRSRDIARLAARKAPLSETLAVIFADRLRQELLRGSERAYLEQEENLRHFKGKLLVARHSLLNSAHRERFYCRYDEFSKDTLMNRVFRASCLSLLDLTHTPGTQDVLRQCLLLLDGVEDVEIQDADFSRIAINRQNERFEDVLRFCRLILSGRTPTIQSGGNRTFSLLFDMNKVFERFVAAFIQKKVMPYLPGYRLFPQAIRNRRHLFESSDGKGVLHLEPDILVQNPQGNFQVIDTKWKNLSGAAGKNYSGANRSDLYQLFAYSERYGCSKSILLYPKVPGISEFYLNIIDNNGRASGSKIGVSFVNINRDLHLPIERQMLAAELKQIVLKGFLIEAINAENRNNNTVGGTA